MANLKDPDSLGRRFNGLPVEHAAEISKKAEGGTLPTWWVPRDEALEFARAEVLRANAVSRALIDRTRAMLEKAEERITDLLAQGYEEPTRPSRATTIIPPPPEPEIEQVAK